MTQKAISLSMAAGILVAYLWSQLQPSGGLFLLMSSNMAVNVFWLILAGLIVRLSFTTKFKTDLGYGLTAGGAMLSLLIGGFGLLAASFNYSFYSWFGPLDFLLLTEAGIIMALCALSIQHRPVKLKTLISRQWLKQQLPKPSFALPRLAVHTTRHPRTS